MQISTIPEIFEHVYQAPGWAAGKHHLPDLLYCILIGWALRHVFFAHRCHFWFALFGPFCLLYGTRWLQSSGRHRYHPSPVHPSQYRSRPSFDDMQGHVEVEPAYFSWRKSNGQWFFMPFCLLIEQDMGQRLLCHQKRVFHCACRCSPPCC